MNKRKKDTRWLASVALMMAVVILLASTPLGMIQLPVVKATTVHIPVILGAILLGPLAGSILGGVFGICSMVSNTMAPTLLSFAFSPFMSMTGISGAVKAVWISVGCRILIGFFAGRSVGTDHGYCYRIRDSGGGRSCSFGGYNWKDYAEIHKVSGFRA